MSVILLFFFYHLCNLLNYSPLYLNLLFLQSSKDILPWHKATRLHPLNVNPCRFKYLPWLGWFSVLSLSSTARSQMVFSDLFTSKGGQTSFKIVSLLTWCLYQIQGSHRVWQKCSLIAQRLVEQPVKFACCLMGKQYLLKYSKMSEGKGVGRPVQLLRVC